MLGDTIRTEYYNWIVAFVGGDNEYTKLMLALHNVEFTYQIPKDYNRADDGIQLRHRFYLEKHYGAIEMEYLDSPCSVLEMLVGLSVRCEEQIMSDEDFGDRTGYWFWVMIKSMGLTNMGDLYFNAPIVNEKINRVLNRTYRSNGEGGLFYIPTIRSDLREVEIWYQLNWYLASINE